MAAAARERDTGLLIGAPEAKKRKVTKKEYVPNIGTANYALLLTLLKVGSYESSKLLQNRASPYLQHCFKRPHPTDFGAWQALCCPAW